MVEVLVGLSLLSFGLLAYAASGLGHHRLTQEQNERSRVLHLSRELVERLQTNDDWAGLYARLRTLETEADAKAPGAVHLSSGRWAHPLSRYYTGAPSPGGAEFLSVLVEVPSKASESDASTNVLREDAQVPRFGLPSDLNGDGELDADPRDADYVALPVILTFSWEVRGQGRRELVRSLWLRGDR